MKQQDQNRRDVAEALYSVFKLAMDKIWVDWILYSLVRFGLFDFIFCLVAY